MCISNYVRLGALQAPRAPRCNPDTARQTAADHYMQGGWVVKNKRHLSRTGRMTERFIQLRWRSPFHHEADPVSQNCYCSAQGLSHSSHSSSFDERWANRLHHMYGKWGVPTPPDLSAVLYKLRVDGLSVRARVCEKSRRLSQKQGGGVGLRAHKQHTTLGTLNATAM